MAMEKLTLFNSQAILDNPQEEDYFEARYWNLKSLQDLVLQRLDVLEKDPSALPFCCVADIPESTIYEHLQEPSLTSRQLFYNQSTKELIVRLTPKYHSMFYHSLKNEIRDKLIALGVHKYDIAPYGATTTEGHSASREGDSGLKPLPECSGVAGCATLMIECVYSQKLSSLHPAVKWWLTEMDVNVVILINVNIMQQSIFLEVWKCVAIDPGVPGLAADHGNWQNRPATEPWAVSSTTISDGNRGFKASDCLSLQFSDVMIRQPSVPDQEITLTEKELAWWAWFIFHDMYS